MTDKNIPFKDPMDFKAGLQVLLPFAVRQHGDFPGAGALRLPRDHYDGLPGDPEDDLLHGILR